MARRILEPDEAKRRLGNISNSNFYDNFVNTGKIRLVHLGPRRRGVLEHELDALIDENCRRSRQHRALRLIGMIAPSAPARRTRWGRSSPNEPK